MSTDFSYNNTNTTTIGGFRPNAKNTPLDSRTVVNNKADIASIPMPFIGMEVTVLQDESKEDNKMTVYKVKSLNEDNTINISTGIEEVTVPKNISDLNNDVNFATESFVTTKIAEASLSGGNVDLAGYAKVTDLPTKTSQLKNDSGYLTSIPEEYITETELEAKGYLTSHQDISNLQSKTDNSLTTTDKTVVGAINELNNKQQLTEITLTSIEDLSNIEVGEYDATIASSYELIKSGIYHVVKTSDTDIVLTSVDGNILSFNNPPWFPTWRQDPDKCFPQVSKYTLTDLSELDSFGRGYFDAYIKSSLSDGLVDSGIYSVYNPGGSITFTSMSGVVYKYNKTGGAWTLETKSNFVTETELNEAIAGISTGGGNSDCYIKRITIEEGNPTNINTLCASINSKIGTDYQVGDILTGYASQITLNYGNTSKVDSGTLVVYIEDYGHSIVYLYSQNNGVIYRGTLSDLAMWGDLVKVGEADLSSYQTITDNTLTTTDKTVIGAINELKTNISNISTGGGSSFSGSYNDLTDKPTIPTKTSDLNNDSGFITSIPEEYITETELNAKGYLTSHQDISGLQPKTDNSLTTTDKTVIGAINELNNKQQLTENTLTSIEHQIEDALNCIDVTNHALRLVIVSKDYETLVFRGKTYNCYDSIAVAIDTEYELMQSFQLGMAVIVMEGTYTECIRLNGKKNISIVGVNKYKCKIVNEETDTKNGYQYPPLWINPSTTVMNLTIQCTTSRNKREAYCIHTDDDGTGKVLIKNCILHCSQHACIGFGTRQDAPLFIEDCDMINDYSNAKSVLLYGHNACAQNTTREEVHITRCYGRTAMGYPLDFFNANWYYPTGTRGSLPWLLYFNDNTFYQGNDVIPTTITVSTEFTGESKDTINFISGGMMRMPSNSGNNIATLNYPYQNAIENVPPTSIAFNTNYITKNDASVSMYEIRNGICYVTMDVTSVVGADGGRVVCTLPKPSSQMQFTIPPYSSKSTIRVGAILFANGNLSLFSTETGQRYMFSFSYPVA